MYQKSKSGDIQHVFIIGSKGIPAAYGGFETFVEKLTEYRVDRDIKYHVACLSDHRGEFEHNHAHCFNVAVPNIGSAKAVYYDVAAFQYCLAFIANKKINHAIIYVLACRIGPFIGALKKRLSKLGGVLYVNPDGHEWKRAKWNLVIRHYWKYSEMLMVKHADLLICDSKNIERYIKNHYRRYHPETEYIAYGADDIPSNVSDDYGKLSEWYRDKGITKKNYYLVVGRFVPENNYEVMIREFMKSKSEKDFVIITTINDIFLKELEKKLQFTTDIRIRFVGTVYDQVLLQQIRENAYGYLHGHEVGGTNPSLLEALASTDLNLLLDVGFNREVAEDAALYWSKREGDLAGLINQADKMDAGKIRLKGKKAKMRISNAYNWKHIVSAYERRFVRMGIGKYMESLGEGK